MNEKIKKITKPSLLKPLLTLNNLGLLIVMMVALSVSWTSVKVIQRNYRIMREIAVLEQEIRLQEIIASNQRLKNEYYKTDTYLEIAARKQFNKALPGEKLMIVPKSLALQKLPDSMKEDRISSNNDKKLSNWQQWMRFLSGQAIRD